MTVLPIYCTGACDACRDYARELGVPLIVAPFPTDEPPTWPDVDCGTAYLHDHYVTKPQAERRGWQHGYVGGRGFEGPHPREAAASTEAVR